MEYVLGAKHLSRCWAPGRAAQIDLELTSERFLEKSQLFGVMKKPILPYSFLWNISADITSTSLDRSWPNEGGKIAPKSIEFTDFEISLFFWPIYTTFWQAFLIWIARAAVLLLELERLYE